MFPSSKGGGANRELGVGAFVSTGCMETGDLERSPEDRRLLYLDLDLDLSPLDPRSLRFLRGPGLRLLL